MSNVVRVVSESGRWRDRQSATACEAVIHQGWRDMLVELLLLLLLLKM